jgi:lipopolysaccharide export system protein LptA
LHSARAERNDREQPVNIEADRLNLDDIKKESVFEGNVTLTQGTLTLKADKILVRQDQQGFNYGIAYGKPAYFRQKREGADEYVEGFAERLEYDGKQDKMQMFTSAHIRKGQDEVRGDYISYDAVTEFYQVIGGGKSVATASNPTGRVQVTIQPKKKIEKPGGRAKAEAAQAGEPPAVSLKPDSAVRVPPSQ